MVPPSVPSGSSVSLEDASNDPYSCKMPFGELRPPIVETITTSNLVTLLTLWVPGATESYIDYQAAAPFADQWQPYLQPITLRLFDSQTSLGGPISITLTSSSFFYPILCLSLCNLALQS